MILLKRYLANWQGLLAIWIIVFFVFIAVAAPWLAPPLDPTSPALIQMVSSDTMGLPNHPDSKNILGTVPVGTRPKQADVFFTLIWGTRSALLFGLSAALIASMIGSVIGGLSSYLGGAAGQLILRITDAFLAFPLIAGIVLFSQLVFPTYMGFNPGPFQKTLSNLGIDTVMLALVSFSWMPYARVIHADMERIRRADFILAAQAVGVSPGRILFRHLIPNSISNALIMAMRDVGGFVLLQATFSFLGVGGGSAWGEILALGRKWIIGSFGNPFEYWWVFLPVTAALLVFSIGWSLLGDYLSEWYNPRLRNYGWD